MTLLNLPRFARIACFVAAGSLLGAGSGEVLPATAPYPPIATMVAAVSADRLKSDVETLVNFGTRNDFSERTSTASHGVFAARDWIAARLRAIAATSGGRMTVKLDTYLQAKTPKTPRAVTESSVIATLQGSEPGRNYVMSSHFDDCDGHSTDGAGIA
ncbi:MAG: hypothetical protein WAK88_09430, partial [Candidatus Cybelea sp.]